MNLLEFLSEENVILNDTNCSEIDLSLLFFLSFFGLC